MTSPATACNASLEFYCSRYGCPRFVISDLGQEFVNKNFLQLTNTNHKVTSAYYQGPNRMV